MFLIKITPTLHKSLDQMCVAGRLPDKTKREVERGLCAQMANNMGPWTTSAA